MADEIDARELHALNLLIQNARSPNHPYAFAIGHLDRRVTIHSQQLRALNLVHALFCRKILKPKDKVLVVGAGLAGLTAAVAAAYRGAVVTLLEREARVLPLLQDCTTRWVHPNLYDWPSPNADKHDAEIPFFSWSANYARDVAVEMERRWRLWRDRLGIKEVLRVEDLDVEPLTPQQASEMRRPVRVRWKANGDNPADDFAVAIFALGFGDEIAKAKLRGYALTPYWRDNDHHQRYLGHAGKKPRSFLVSGTGDGALIDLLRIRLGGFRYERLVAELFDTRNPKTAEIRKKLEDIEKTADEVGGDAREHITTEYAKLEVPEVDAALRVKLCERADTTAVLNSTSEHPFDRGSSILNRFLVSRLLAMSEIDLLPGKLLSVKRRRDGLSFDCEVSGGTATIKKTFDEVVIRHGAQLPHRMSFGKIFPERDAPFDPWMALPPRLFTTPRDYPDPSDDGAPPGGFSSTRPTVPPTEAPVPPLEASADRAMNEAAVEPPGRRLVTALCKILDEKRAVLVSGPAGIGKSWLVDQIAGSFGQVVVDVEISARGLVALRAGLRSDTATLFILDHPWGRDELAPDWQAWTDELSWILSSVPAEHCFLITTREGPLRAMIRAVATPRLALHLRLRPLREPPNERPKGPRPDLEGGHRKKGRRSLAAPPVECWQPRGGSRDWPPA